MARRRGWRQSRYSPDRAWWFNTDFQSFAAANGTGGNSTNNADPIMLFEDINSDNTNIAAEKPDWYIKRIIFEAWLLVDNVGPSQTVTPVRPVVLSLAIMGIQDSGFFTTQVFTPIDPQYHELASRVLRQETLPVYVSWNPIVDAAGGGSGLRTEEGVGGQVNAAAPFFGPANVYWDFEVSNANVREQQALYLHKCIDLDFNAFWVQNETLTVCHRTRVLLQKRRT